MNIMDDYNMVPTTNNNKDEHQDLPSLSTCETVAAAARAPASVIFRVGPSSQAAAPSSSSQRSKLENAIASHDSKLSTISCLDQAHDDHRLAVIASSSPASPPMSTSEHTFSDNYSVCSDENDIYFFSSSCGSSDDDGDGYLSSDFGDDAASFTSSSTLLFDDDSIFNNNLFPELEKNAPTKKSVRFNETVLIREYAVTIGTSGAAFQKNASCSLTLDWPYRMYTATLATLECKVGGNQNNREPSLPFFSSNRHQRVRRLSVKERRQQVGRVQGWSSDQVQELEYSRLVHQIDEVLSICCESEGRLLPGMVEDGDGSSQQQVLDPNDSSQSFEIYE